MVELKNIKQALGILGFKGVVKVEQKELKRAYKKRSKEVHPDVGGSHSAFKELQSAYDLLLDSALGLTVDLEEKLAEVIQGSSLLRYRVDQREYRFKL